MNFPFNLSNWRNYIFQSCELISLDREANPKLWVSPRNLEKSLFSRLSKIYWSEPLLYFTPNTPKKRVHNYFLYAKYPQKACSWLSISNSLLWNWIYWSEDPEISGFCIHVPLFRGKINFGCNFISTKRDIFWQIYFSSNTITYKWNHVTVENELNSMRGVSLSCVWLIYIVSWKKV